MSLLPKSLFSRCSALCIASLLGCSAIAQAEVHVDHERVRAVPPSSSNSAGYLRLHNDADSVVYLTSASSSIAATVELHQVLEHEGMLSMSPIERIEIPAGASVSLQPGGLHLMLLDLQQPLKEGDSVDLQLKFSDGQSIELKAPVKRIAPKQQMAHPDAHKKAADHHH